MTPIPMSLFQDVMTITNDTQFVVVAKDGGGNNVSGKVSGSLAAEGLGPKRWILPAPTYASDPRGVDGSESYNQPSPTTLEYFIKFNGLWYKTSLNLVNPIL